MSESALRLAGRLEAALRTVGNPIQRACLRAELAGVRARQGEAEQAATEISALRREFELHPEVEVSVWLCIAEGWLAHYTSLSGSATDKMKRALALSTAAGLSGLQALSSAWLAHFSFVRDDFVSMSKQVELTLRLVTAPHEHATLARVGLVVGSAYHFAERLDLARAWYAMARHHAAADGDDSMLSSLSYNMAANNSNHVFRASIFGGNSAEMARHADAGVDATGNFDNLAGVSSLDSLVPILRAMRASLKGDYKVAIETYEQQLDASEKQGFLHMHAVFLADIAWCRFQMGDVTGATRDSRAAVERLQDSMPVEDLATANGRLRQVFALLGNDLSERHHGNLAEQYWAQYKAMQMQIIDLLSAIPMPLRPPTKNPAEAGFAESSDQL